MVLRFWVFCLMVLGCTIGIAPPAQADELRPGYLELTERRPGAWDLLWKAPVLGGLATRATPLLPPACTVKAGPTRLQGAAMVATGTVSCPGPIDGQPVGLRGIESSFTDALLRVQPLGRPLQTARLTRDSPTMTVSAQPDRWQVARTYTLIGVEHILAGFDHLLFVIALVLLLQRGWPVVKAATAFTAAHSITLIGSTMGLVGLPQAPVEALIALSIIVLAVEIAKRRDGAPGLTERVPWMVAFLFGLLHGFGFAGALREIGLPESDLAVALLTFNLGVELGQLIVIGLTLALLALLRRLGEAICRPALTTATYLIGITASYWFIERVVT